MPPSADFGAWLGICSLVISIAVLVFGALQYKHIARKDFVTELSKRVEKCEEEHGECERERNRLTRLSMELLEDSRRMASEIVRLEGQKPDG